MKMKFSAITTADELLKFLSTKRHNCYHHFTTIETLSAILKNRTWRLSPARKMNDLHECNEKGDLQEWRKIVSTCFSFGDEDNIAMWAMYGVPGEKAVRITIPCGCMKKWINELSHACEENYSATHSASSDANMKEWIDQKRLDETIADISLHDIVYYDGRVDSQESKLRWARGVCSAMKDSDTDIAKSARFTGFVKNSAWIQEAETRLAIKWNDDFMGDHYDIPVPEYVLGSMKISFGPWFSKNTPSDRDLAINEILDGSGIGSPLRETIINNTSSCFFEGRVNLKQHALCDECEYKREAMR